MRADPVLRKRHHELQPSNRPQIVGSRATRSTHPFVLSLVTAFARHVLRHPFEVTNPFIWQTKAEIIRFIDGTGRRI